MSCRHNARCLIPVPGGAATGKVTSLSLIAGGDGKSMARFEIGCAVGFRRQHFRDHRHAGVCVGGYAQVATNLRWVRCRSRSGDTLYTPPVYQASTTGCNFRCAGKMSATAVSSAAVSPSRLADRRVVSRCAHAGMAQPTSALDFNLPEPEPNDHGGRTNNGVGRHARAVGPRQFEYPLRDGGEPRLMDVSAQTMRRQRSVQWRVYNQRLTTRGADGHQSRSTVFAIIRRIPWPDLKASFAHSSDWTLGLPRST